MTAREERPPATPAPLHVPPKPEREPDVTVYVEDDEEEAAS